MIMELKRDRKGNPVMYNRCPKCKIFVSQRLNLCPICHARIKGRISYER